VFTVKCLRKACIVKGGGKKRETAGSLAAVSVLRGEMNGDGMD
jgi:hypothetical protein